jgi:hypothetical protein
VAFWCFDNRNYGHSSSSTEIPAGVLLMTLCIKILNSSVDDTRPSASIELCTTEVSTICNPEIADKEWVRDMKSSRGIVAGMCGRTERP